MSAGILGTGLYSRHNELGDEHQIIHEGRASNRKDTDLDIFQSVSALGLWIYRYQ